jgi:hypothetical protein
VSCDARLELFERALCREILFAPFKYVAQREIFCAYDMVARMRVSLQSCNYLTARAPYIRARDNVAHLSSDLRKTTTHLFAIKRPAISGKQFEHTKTHRFYAAVVKMCNSIVNEQRQYEPLNLPVNRFDL